MTPENIVECTKLYDYYTNGFGDGNSDHRLHIRLPKQQLEVQSKSSGSDTLDAGPVLEQEWFDHPDPYDLAESARIDAENPDDVRIERCSGRWKVASFVKLDSPALGSLIKHLSGEKDTSIIGSTALPSETASVPSGKPDD